MKGEIKYLMQGLIGAIIVCLCIIFFSQPHKKKKSEITIVRKDGVHLDDLMQSKYLAEGKALYQDKCITCHPLRNYDGPSILNVEYRVTDRNMLRRFVKNAPAVIQSGNPYFASLYKQYGVMMTAFPELSDEQINNILDYIKVISAYHNLPDDKRK